MKRKISIILLWWSYTQELEDFAQTCLHSILDNTVYPDYEVIIIENKPDVLNGTKSKDSVYPSPFLQQFKHRKVKIYFNDANLGFIKGNNQGIRLAERNDVLLLNNDTQVPRGWLEPIMNTLELHPDCGMAMPIQIHKASKEFFEYDGNIPKLMEFMAKMIAQHSHRDMSSPMVNGNWLPLCATVLTRKAIDKVGFLDEEFAIGGFEDTDYSWMCIDAGFKLYVTSGSSIFHHYGQSFHYHEGYAEVWVEKGKYLMKKHNAKQDSKGNVYRQKDKPKGWKPQ